jgi:hypothetical protein
LFHTGSAPGIHPSKPYLPAGIQPFPSGRTHLPFNLPLFPTQNAGPARQVSVPGLCPCRKFRPTANGFSTAVAGGSLGFLPSRVFHKGLDQDFARSPLTRFLCRTASDSTDRRPRVSIDPCLDVPSPLVSQERCGSQPFEGFCTAPILSVQAHFHPGYEFTFRCVVHYCRLASDPWMENLALPEPSGFG